MVMRRASADGEASAAPMPCTARAASSCPDDPAKPPTSEASVNRVMPARKVAGVRWRAARL
jgi:hypothetical protein